MNKRGIALVISFSVVLVLFMLLGSFFIKTINENNSAKRYVNSVRALWLAEAGVADAKRNLPNSPINNSLGGYRYETNTTLRTTIGSDNYYDITSIGIVTLPTGGDITRTVDAVVKKGSADPSKFNYAIRAANDLCFGGQNCNKDPYDFIEPNSDICGDGDDPCWKEQDPLINFDDLFNHTQTEVESIATHYNETNFTGAVSGVTWVDVTAGETLMATGGLTGSGVLIIDGDVQFGGTYQFYGIIYVLGNMTARGTFDNFGGTIVASSVGVDSINGTPEFHYSPADIEDALEELEGYFKTIVSWKES